jgi:glucose-1-phosphate thymidylyltransferase
VYCFDRRIIEAAENISPSARGELEITDAIQWLVDHGYDVRPYILQGYWIDTGKMEDILAANRQVLTGIGYHVDERAVIEQGSVLQGDVVVQAGAQVTNSVVRGPAIIGERARIVNAYVGPFTSIYHDVTIENSEVEYCIILEHSRVSNMSARLESSLIGRHAEVEGSHARPRGHKLMLGDYSKVSIDD